MILTGFPLKKELDGIKVLGNGKLTKKLTVVATKFSKSAIEKIQAVQNYLFQMVVELCLLIL